MTLSLSAQVEAVLFAVARPLSAVKIGKALGVSEEEARAAVLDLWKHRNDGEAGVQVLEAAGEYTLVSHPAAAGLLAQFVKDEAASELTRPSLETLTIIAYRGPLTQPEIEQIRGVNCTLILRHLLMRDMIVEEMSDQKLQPVYSVSVKFLRHLGLVSIQDLPSYKEFAEHPEVAALLAQVGAEQPSSV